MPQQDHRRNRRHGGRSTTASERPALAALRPFEVHNEKTAASCAIGVSGELDVATVPQLQRALDEARRRSRHPVIIDVGALEFINGGGLATLLAASRRLRATGFAIASPSQPVRRLFELVGVDAQMLSAAAGPPLSAPPTAGRRPL